MKNDFRIVCGILISLGMPALSALADNNPPKDTGKSNDPAKSAQGTTEAQEAGLWRKIGDSLLKQGNINRAIRSAAATAEQGAALYPENAGLLTAAGAAYLETKEYGRSERASRRAISLDDNNAVAHHNLGMALIRQGRRAEGRKELQRGIDIGGPAGHGERGPHDARQVPRLIPPGRVASVRGDCRGSTLPKIRKERTIEMSNSAETLIIENAFLADSAF